MAHFDFGAAAERRIDPNAFKDSPRHQRPANDTDFTDYADLTDGQIVMDILVPVEVGDYYHPRPLFLKIRAILPIRKSVVDRPEAKL